ncbi:MAG: hypothetical protein HY696_07745 [Deltaproteobacteria bacterium]|nr:hypothetical protein [Deltaproteobacteria bacterium]
MRKMTLHRINYVLLAVLLGATLGCSGRQPKPAVAQRIITKHFQRYAKKFPESSLGRAPVTSAEVQGIEEVHKHYLILTTALHQQDGQGMRARVALEKHVPGGWHVVAWERDE